MRHKMNIALVLCCLCLPLLASCGPGGVGDTLLYNEWYRTGCPGFPNLAEVESVLAEHQELVQRLESIRNVFVRVDGFGDCPGGRYLNIYHGSVSTAWEILEILDEAGAREEGPRTFFGVPFLLHNR